MKKLLLVLLFVPLMSFGQNREESNKNFKYYYERGVEKSETGDINGAIAEFTKAIEVAPNHRATPGTFYARGVLKNQLGKYKEAIKDYNESLNLGIKQGDGKSTLAIAYNGRGNSKGLSGDIQGACIDWKKADEFGFKGLTPLITQYCK